MEPQKRTHTADVSPPPAPRWAKVAGVIAAVVVAMMLIMLLTGNRHGPGRHLHGGNDRPAGVEHGHDR